VARLIPSILAARHIISMMLIDRRQDASRSAAAAADLVGVAEDDGREWRVAERSRRQSGVTGPPCAIAVARTATSFNSRMLPGHGQSVENRKRDGYGTGWTGHPRLPPAALRHTPFPAVILSDADQVGCCRR